MHLIDDNKVPILKSTDQYGKQLLPGQKVCVLLDVNKEILIILLCSTFFEYMYT